jgi:hypothetical protein
MRDLPDDGGNAQKSVTQAVIGAGETRFMQIGEPQRTIVVEPLVSPLPNRDDANEPEPAATPELEPMEVSAQ